MDCLWRRQRGRAVFTSFADPASQWTDARKSSTFFACSDISLIERDNGVVLDMEAGRSFGSIKGTATRMMIERTWHMCGLTSGQLATDPAYGSCEMLIWRVAEGIEPHFRVIDKSEQNDGTLSCAEFRYDPDKNSSACPGG